MGEGWPILFGLDHEHKDDVCCTWLEIHVGA